LIVIDVEQFDCYDVLYNVALKLHQLNDVFSTEHCDANNHSDWQFNDYRLTYRASLIHRLLKEYFLDNSFALFSPYVKI
ncbi:hypothetical protein Bhyg_14511, partial [Pseudolycoriella hygida]